MMANNHIDLSQLTASEATIMTEILESVDSMIERNHMPITLAIMNYLQCEIDRHSANPHTSVADPSDMVFKSLISSPVSTSSTGNESDIGYNW